MATVWDHLSVEELEDRFVGCEDATASRHFQVIWLLARGHTISQVSGTTAYGERWIEQLLARYNAEGPEGLGDLRRRNGAPATILKPDLLAKLRLRLDDPPPDGGLWSSRKVAAWTAGELNLTSVAPQRSWEALKAIGSSIQKPRPKNPKSATPEEAAAFKEARECRCRGGGKAPGQTDRGLRHGRASHWPKAHHAPRVGATRRASDRGWPSPVRLALCHGILSPATGETFWYVSNGVSKEFFEALLETFAREAEAGLSRIILLALDNAGWHGPANLKIPDGVRLIYLPPYSPELQPAETLWALVDEPIVNQHIATIADLDEKIAAQCIALSEQREQIQSRTGFHWWPKRIAPN